METKIRNKRPKPAYYSDEFKQGIIQEYLKGGISKSKLQYKYGIKGRSSISYWMLNYGYSVVSENNAILELNPVELAKKDTSIDSATTKAMAAEIKRLKQQLDDERLRSEMLNRMVDLAEKTYKITVRKNSNTK
jgi:transposase-like protein